MNKGVKKINEICKSIRSITEEDFCETEKMAKEQQGYSHPFNHATAKWQHELGTHNLKILKALRELQSVIREGEHIKKP